MNEFSGKDLSGAWDDGARARLQDLIDFITVASDDEVFFVSSYIKNYIEVNEITNVDTSALK